ATEFQPEDIVGSWKMEPVAGALGVGPASGDISWFSTNEDDITARACYFDDVYTFDVNGSYSYEMDGSTWVETWQEGVTADGCGTPVAPHDNSGSYTYEATATTIKLNGEGAFIGLAKAVNAGELSNAEIMLPSDVTYTVKRYSVTNDGKKFLTLEIQAGTAFWTYRLVSE
ncbi:MAG: hypothetical protein WBA74_03450, partial [Cyclobacteriaceae bacterium]